MVLLAKCALNIPASFEAGFKPRSWDVQKFSPFAKAFTLAVEFVLSCIFVARSSPIERLSARNRKRISKRPFEAVKSLSKCRGTYASKFRPFYDGPGFAVMGNEPVASSVPVLHFSGGPAAIARFISSAVVDSVKRIAKAGAVTHIFNKVFKAVPALANRNPAPAVIGKRTVSWVIATRKHAVPNLVLGSFGKTVRDLLFGSAALARLNFSLPLRIKHLAATTNNLFATLAHAQPVLQVLISGGSVSLRYNGPKAELSAAQINWISHKSSLRKGV